MKNIVFAIVIFIALLGTYGCEKLHDLNQPKDPDTKYSSTYPLSGEWWVQYYTFDGTAYSEIGLGHVPLFTSNTAADDGKEMWISDDGTFWTYTVKCPVDMSSLTFSGDSLISTADDGDGNPYDIWVNIAEGKVIKNGGKSPSGVVMDSIFFKMEFEDEPGSFYYAAGIRKTGFLEDEYEY
jgi:hypothetical protein